MTHDSIHIPPDLAELGKLIEPAALKLIHERREDLRRLNEDEIELLYRSALAAGYEAPYWRGRAPAVVGKVERELFDGLGSEDAQQAGRAVSGLLAIASPEVVERLAREIEAGFSDAPAAWADHTGKEHKLGRTVLNLATLRQQHAVAALGRMTAPGAAQALPEATEALKRWTPPGMILIPAGPFTMGGEENNNEGPVHEVWLEAFWIDRFPITNAQWAAFVNSGAWQERELWSEAGWKWLEGKKSPHQPDQGKADHPVVSVTWYESLAFTRWAGKALLSEAQWEKAARGTDARRYPWGEEFDAKKCNTSESDIGTTTPVGKYSPAGDSPYGVADMAGNVWEWTASLYRPYPCQPNDQRDDPEAAGIRILRGGSFGFNEDPARCAARSGDDPHYVLNTRGFRCGVVSSRSLPLLAAGSWRLAAGGVQRNLNH